MSLRILHTADWQLGKPFQSLPVEVAALVREARVAAVRTIAALAVRHEVAAVLVAGDVFDSNLAPERTVLQALAAMRGFGGPWLLLPGNHDTRLAEGVWDRLERLGRPENVLVADTAHPIPVADGRQAIRLSLTEGEDRQSDEPRPAPPSSSTRRRARRGGTGSKSRH